MYIASSAVTARRSPVGTRVGSKYLSDRLYLDGRHGTAKLEAACDTCKDQRTIVTRDSLTFLPGVCQLYPSYPSHPKRDTEMKYRFGNRCFSQTGIPFKDVTEEIF